LAKIDTSRSNKEPLLVFGFLRCFSADLSPIKFSAWYRIKNIGEIIYNGNLFKITLELSPRLFEKLPKHLEAPPILFLSFLQ
jgi:hypothetical protein